MNATLPVSLVMVRALRDFRERVGFDIGFKPAGGLRSAKDALAWLILMKEELGLPWMQPDLFRIGASGSRRLTPPLGMVCLLQDCSRRRYGSFAPPAALSRPSGTAAMRNERSFAGQRGQVDPKRTRECTWRLAVSKGETALASGIREIAPTV